MNLRWSAPGHTSDPALAQAKTAAKKTSELSNVKQLGTGLQIYIADFDDVYPTAGLYDWSGAPNGKYWARKVFPYVKNLGIFRSPLDSMRTGPDQSGWSGFELSWGANSVMGGGTNPDNVSRGIFGVRSDDWAGFSWFAQGAGTSSTAVTNPSSTVAFAPKYSMEVAKCPGHPNWLGGNYSDFWPTSLFLWVGDGTDDHYYDQCAGAPSGRLPATGVWGRTNVGAVSVVQNRANMSFADSSAKSMAPVATNPDPLTRPQDNMWDALR